MAEGETLVNEQGEVKGVREAMKPWEQHASVISIPRFDYTAHSSLLQHSNSGFLITCPIKREKSATKEAMSILEKHIGSCISRSFSDGSDGDKVIKRRKLCPVDGISTETIDGKSVAPRSPDCGVSEISKDVHLYPDKNGGSLKKKYTLSLVKLTRSGLLLFTFPRDSSLDPVSIASNIIQSLECGTLGRPLWCHRIFPIQATCILNKKELQAIATNLVLQFVNDKGDELSRPLKFAVGYNRRGLEETHVKVQNTDFDNSHPSTLFDRNKCFAVVAAAVKDVVSDSVVDLKSPELAVLVELLPISGLPKGSLVAAVSVLPGDLINTKPRLCVRALVSDSKA
ncbi:hypothetical protein Nepgr_008567 [Nepenthes gracilis]|uniref:THUMP domain-containing protein n=1 Tax=Nepenthes gracilis TaxID=150966 RepID=A0AAD3S954_NEPGR|nr:hypothetical protein Nepgr_008567 [Nepenthes gracilis]